MTPPTCRPIPRTSTCSSGPRTPRARPVTASSGCPPATCGSPPPAVPGGMLTYSVQVKGVRPGLQRVTTSLTTPIVAGTTRRSPPSTCCRRRHVASTTVLDHVSIQCATWAVPRSTTRCLRHWRRPHPRVRRGHRLRRRRKPDFWLGPANRARASASPILRSRPPTGRRCGRSSTPRWPPGPRCCTSRGSGPSTTRTTTARSCATLTATTSKPSATSPVAPMSSGSVVGPYAAHSTTDEGVRHGEA